MMTLIDDTDMYGISFEYNISQHLNITALYGQTDGIIEMNGFDCLNLLLIKN